MILTHIVTSMSPLFIALALLVTGCGTYTPRYAGASWIYSALSNCAPHYRSAEAYYPPSYPCGSLSLELIKDAGGLRMYLNLLMLPMCPEDLYSDCINFDVTIDSVLYQAKATVLEGGQRLLLDQPSMNRLIDAWLARQTVHINAGLHAGDISPTQFARCYEAIMQFPM